MRRLRLEGLAWLLGAAVLLAGAPPGAAEESILAYGAECTTRIGSIPVFDCADPKTGTIAAITVNGKEPTKYIRDMKCDRPALLQPAEGEVTDGQCVPYSVAHVLRDDDQVQISAFCRKKLIRAPDSHLYDEIDIILHSVTTGSTCWFQAKADNPTGDHGKGLNGRRVPPPDEVEPPPGHPAAIDFWHSPEKTASENCGTCHDNDPFYYSPYIAQTGQLPANPLGRYAHDIGEAFKKWPPPESLTTRGNTCTGCHRIGVTHTCGEGAEQSIGAIREHAEPSPSTDDGERKVKAWARSYDEWARRYPHSHWMPVDNLWTERQWKLVYAQSVERLRECCVPEDERPADCEVTAVPSG